MKSTNFSRGEDNDKLQNFSLLTKHQVQFCI